ncbi:MAG: 30S ribosomal protein S3 [Nanoarchaeota archaeon]|nr:30S ribosomal protein S3 [Nanoarchaeota archaeon]
MEAKKFVNFKKEELGVKEFVKGELGKGRISNVTIEYTPIGEKIIISTSKPGLVIGRRGEKIDFLTKILKKRFKLDNPHIEIREIYEPKLDAQLVADEIALLLERKGSLKFKVIAYKMLQEIVKAGALGIEIVLSGKLPSDRAKRWRFTQGYLKKTGDPSKVVDRAQSQAKTISGIIGIEISLLHPDAHIHDRIVVDDALRSKLKITVENMSLQIEQKEKTKKTVKKLNVKENKENDTA